jgi:hypothetical protein
LAHRHRAHEYHRAAISHALQEFDIDVVHMHGINFDQYLPRNSDVPVLVTLHLPPSWYALLAPGVAERAASNASQVMVTNW